MPTECIPSSQEEGQLRGMRQGGGMPPREIQILKK